MKTLKELEDLWNKEADNYNQWDNLGLDEKIAFAQEVAQAERGEFICMQCGLLVNGIGQPGEFYGMKHAQVWRFDDAPEELRALSDNGGDEDWLAVVPDGFCDYGIPFWMQAMDSCREPQDIPHPTKDGFRVIIGSHA